MFRSILATIYNQSQLAERKHVARYWLINTAATAVPLSAHHSSIEVAATKLAAAILGGGLFGGNVLPAQYCPCGRYLMVVFHKLRALQNTCSAGFECTKLFLNYQKKCS